MSCQSLPIRTAVSPPNLDNLVDPNRPEGNVTVSGDDTTAKAAFKASDLASLPGTEYFVYAVGQDGTEAATGQRIALGSTLSISKINPPSMDLPKIPENLATTGTHLDKVTTVCFSMGSATTGQSVKLANDSGVQATAGTGSIRRCVCQRARSPAPSE